MQMEELLRLVKQVGDAGLSNFEYKEGNIYISMSCAVEKPKPIPKEKIQVKTNLTVEPMKPETAKQGMEEKPEEKKVCETGKKQAPAAAPEKENTASVKEIVEAPIEGRFSAKYANGSDCILKVGDKITEGQVLGALEAWGNVTEVISSWTGTLTNIYVSDGEDMVAREPLFGIVVTEEV